MVCPWSRRQIGLPSACSDAIAPNTSRTTPVGVRVDVTDRIALRGELRARFDVEQDGGSGANLEQTLGLSLRF